MGQALRWTPEQIALFARVSEEDEQRARRLWREHSGDGMSSLLDAKGE